ncbi:MAG: DUF4252 domain-containing protein [Flavobacterium sp.]|nr:MAG: DUF4252 domain-containing protein [Flavobacterium sp.]
MKKIHLIAIICSLFLASCNSEPSLQKYFVEKTENKDFIAVDISPDILNVEKTKLTPEQSEALKSFEKMNILAFKLDSSNVAQYDVERAKVTDILKNEKYQKLMSFGSGKDGVTVSFVGEEENIEEFVVYAKSKETGFAVVRIIGDKMNPTHIMNMLSVMQQSNIDLDQLKPLQEMMMQKK